MEENNNTMKDHELMNNNEDEQSESTFDTQYCSRLISDK